VTSIALALVLSANFTRRTVDESEKRMCGIVGVVGRGPAAAPILDALRRLEYRGYDSAGTARLERGLLTRRRAVGKLKNLESKLTCEPLVGLIGISHTRWATHGRPIEKNAHPHAVDGVAVVHNGIIENHRELRNELKQAGVRFATDTDTEVIAHLVNQQPKKGCEPVDAVRVALPWLEGAFALAFLFEGYENLIIGARKGSPLAVGYGRDEMYLGSDAIALAPLTDMISYLEDGDVAVVTRQGTDFFNATSSARKSSVMNTWNFGLSSSASKAYWFRKTRTCIAKVLMRFSDAYADLALRIAPWLEEDGAGR